MTIAAEELKNLVEKRYQEAQRLWKKIYKFLVTDKMGACTSKEHDDYTEAQWLFDLRLTDLRFSVFWDCGGWRVGDGKVIIRLNDKLVFHCTFNGDDTKKMTLHDWIPGAWEKFLSPKKVSELRDTDTKNKRKKENETKQHEEELEKNRLATDSELAHARSIGIKL